MTKSTATKIISDSSTTTSEKRPLYYPVTASEAYHLGLEMEKMLNVVYQELETKCQSTSSKKVLKALVKQNQEDIKNFHEGFNYALNCEIGEFYRNKGAVISHESVEKEIASSKHIIMRNIENFIRKNEAIQNDLKNKEGNTIGEYFNAKNSMEVLEVGLKVRENSYELYQRLAKLYTDVSIRNAFEEMAEIIKEGSNRISQIF